MRLELPETGKGLGKQLLQPLAPIDFARLEAPDGTQTFADDCRNQLAAAPEIAICSGARYAGCRRDLSNGYKPAVLCQFHRFCQQRSVSPAARARRRARRRIRSPDGGLDRHSPTGRWRTESVS